MIFIMAINCDNASFADPGDPGLAVAEVLRSLADSVEEGGNYFRLRDPANGHHIGDAEYREEDTVQAHGLTSK